MLLALSEAAWLSFVRQLELASGLVPTTHHTGCHNPAGSMYAAEVRRGVRRLQYDVPQVLGEGTACQQADIGSGVTWKSPISSIFARLLAIRSSRACS